MKKNPRKHTVRRNPKTYTGNFYVPFGTSYLFVDLEYRGKLLHTYKGTSSLDVPELKQKCRTFAENQKATVKFKGLKELGIKENPRKRALKRNGAGRVTHNGHVITIKDSVYTVQPYKKAFSGPDGFVRAKKWIDAHVLRESGQGWKLKKNPKAGTWSNGITTSTLRTKDGKIVVTNVKRYLDRFVGNSHTPGWYAYFIYDDVGGPVSLWHVGPFNSRSGAKAAGKKRLKPMSNPRKRAVRRRNPVASGLTATQKRKAEKAVELCIKNRWFRGKVGRQVEERVAKQYEKALSDLRDAMGLSGGHGYATICEQVEEEAVKRGTPSGRPLPGKDF